MPRTIIEKQIEEELRKGIGKSSDPFKDIQNNLDVLGLQSSRREEEDGI